MDFNSSTHRRHWLFTKETLREVQEETAKLAAEACAAGTPPEGSRSFAVTRSTASDKSGGRVTTDNEEGTLDVKGEGGVPATDTGEGDSGGKGKGGGSGKKRPAPTASSAEPLLTVEEECLVKNYYAKKIQETCGRDSADEDLRRSDKVQATAIAYFHRFYLSNSVLEHDPKILILTCVFLASKTEEQMTNVNLLAKATGLDDLQILGKELTLLQGLSFHLAVFHPYRALPALVEGARLKAKTEGIPPQPERIMALHDGARAALDDIVVTDLPFLHPPSRLALAALLRESRRMEAPPFDLPALLGKEFGDREGWKDVLREAQRLALELDEILPYRVEKDKLIAVNKKLKKHAWWSQKRGRAEGGGGRERRKSKKIKTEA
ncbi:unnamed protein product [Ectocarpus sp. 8 AP-2014]